MSKCSPFRKVSPRPSNDRLRLRHVAAVHSEVLFARGGGDEERIGGGFIRDRRFTHNVDLLRYNVGLAGHLLAKQPAVAVAFCMPEIRLNRQSCEHHHDRDRGVSEIFQGEHALPAAPVADRDNEIGPGLHA